MSSESGSESLKQLNIQLDLSEEETQRSKERKLHRLNTIKIPLLRLLGFSLLAIYILLYNIFVIKTPDWSSYLQFLAIVYSYSLVSWLLLYSFYDKVKLFPLDLLFLIIDLFFWALAIYHS
ncbi:MAG: hypothetical protein AB1489_37995, partial [Acidobacteriota bacterium]